LTPTQREFALAQVVARFLLRLLLLIFFGSFGGQGFAKTFATLLLLAAFVSACLALLKREAPLGPVLTHWDEAVVYAVLSRLVTPFA
jgi:hypothetical protein